jgi:hypothetical protein
MRWIWSCHQQWADLESAALGVWPRILGASNSNKCDFTVQSVAPHWACSLGTECASAEVVIDCNGVLDTLLQNGNATLRLGLLDSSLQAVQNNRCAVRCNLLRQKCIVATGNGCMCSTPVGFLS